MQYTRIKLPYALDALEPHISKETMDWHYNKHHKAYEDALNQAMKSDELKSLPEKFADLEYLVSNYRDPQITQNARVQIRQFGGGLINHNFYFQIMKKDTILTDEALINDIKATFKVETIEAFLEQLKAAALGVFGSGWAWLVVDYNHNKRLRIYKTFNQDNVWFLNMKPLIGVDVWEHAYYIDYRSNRGKYIDNFFKVINWDKVTELYHQYKNEPEA